MSEGALCVNFNLHLSRSVKISGGKGPREFQVMIGNVHVRVYSLPIDIQVVNVHENSRFFKAMDTIPRRCQMASWARVN